ncbi:MAG: hypothetical protein DWQ19_08820 [Crenarchaeota archaeon]|nr:MAG: hypothetical protein DWQ19_08820 [Thermoproteota archaeon]
MPVTEETINDFNKRLRDLIVDAHKCNLQLNYERSPLDDVVEAFENELWFSYDLDRENASNQRTVKVLWGSESFRNQQENPDEPSVYEFNTEEEAEAFRLALSEADGYVEWEEV